MQLTKRKEEPTTEVHDLTAEVLRAEEFEHLAKLCMDHKQCVLLNLLLMSEVK